MKKLNKKGFTLAELLIVVAIIAVLVGISIPIFTAQLEKAREATDAANIRSAYAEVSANYLTADTDAKKVTSEDVTLTQQRGGWQDTAIKLPEKLTVAKDATPIAKGTATIAIDKDGNVTLTYAAA